MANRKRNIQVKFYVTAEEKELILKAKALLMERNTMTEPEAYRYIQKCSMDNGTSLTETAQMIISLIHM